jgi:hypothetical protein
MDRRAWLFKTSLLAIAIAASVRVGNAQSSDKEAKAPLTPFAPQNLSKSEESSVIPYSPLETRSMADWRPLSGVQKLTIGTTPPAHSFLLPSFTVMTQAQSNSYSSEQQGGRNVWTSTYLAGRLAVNHVTSASALLLDYVGGGSFSQGSGPDSSWFQNLNLSSTFKRGRWSLMAGDQFSYLPQSPFGFGGAGGLNAFGVPLGNGVGVSPDFNSGVTPDQTIFINQRLITNTVIGQAAYELSHRSSMTFSGSYGLMTYGDSGLRDSRQELFSSGYNYLVSRKDTIAFSYTHSRFVFPGNGLGFSGHVGMLRYARQLSGRLSFQIGAGPEIQAYDYAASGPQTVVSWALATSANYVRGRLSTTLSYAHALSGGSGVFRGSEADTVTGTASGSLGKSWNSLMSLGYARNAALEQTAGRGNSLPLVTWYGTAGIARHFLQRGSLFLTYTVAQQSVLLPVCDLPACRSGSATHQGFGSIGYTWGTRPIVLR